MKQQSLVILKPDAIKKKVAGPIMTRIVAEGFYISDIKVHQITDNEYDEHYGHIKELPFYEDMRKYMLSEPVIILVVEGEDAIAKLRVAIGPTRGAPKGTIRGDFGSEDYRNLIHASDSEESARQEIIRFKLINEKGEAV